MSIAQFINVNTSYTRSINIERDSEHQNSVRPYILTSRAIQVLDRFADTLKPIEIPRAWALVGPYGSGKSAFGLLLSQLLGNKEDETTKHAIADLQQVAPELAARFIKNCAATNGYCIVTLAGTPEPLGRRLVQALNKAVLRYFSDRRDDLNLQLFSLLEDVANETNPKASHILTLISELQHAITNVGGAGLLIVVDELGKFLEYEARHRTSSEIFLLQALAEHAFRPDEAPLQLVVLLHQSFEQYAQTFGDQLRNEWKKVQGRFESIPFVETAEQVIRVIRAAIVHNLDLPLETRLEVEARRFAASLAQHRALPPGILEDEAAELFAACYPLHPVSLLVLPALCQRVAQNERTLFSYLGSQEPHGFMESLDRLNVREDRLDLICPLEIYDYFILNQPGLVTDPNTHRRWAEVVTAVERLGDALASEISLIKMIGLMNIVGIQGGLKASFEVLSLCYENDKTTSTTLDTLGERSLITFRKFSGEYRVWQGSDFDIETALSEQISQIGQVDIAELLNQAKPMAPIVARRHAIATGTLRYYQPDFISAQSMNRIRPMDKPTLFVCLADAADEVNLFRKKLIELGKGYSLGVIVGNPESLREAVLTIFALLRIQRENALLANDPVAQRELKDRLSAAKKNETAIIASILENPSQSEWVAQGCIPLIYSKRQLQQKFSEILDQIYSSAPLLHNELINRDKPSASAIAGRNKLITAMFEHGHEEDLGIEKYPSEKSMYLALLKATGLHHKSVDGWQFGLSSSLKDKYQIRPVWQAIEKQLADTESNPIPVAELFAYLAQPPYGLKAGVIPILFLTIVLANRDELALFEEGNFVPFLTVEIYERLLKNPKSFGLQRFRIDSLREDLFRRYAEIVSGEMPNEVTLLTAVKPLAQMMVNLPDYTKRTKHLSPEALSVRDLFFQSKSPVQLVLVDLPKACGFSSFANIKPDAEQLQMFGQKFQSVIGELRGAYHSLLWIFMNMLKKAFGIEKDVMIQDLRDMLRGRYMQLESYTIDIHGLRAFLGRIVDPYGEETPWLISIASFLGRKPPEKWTDDDIKAVEYRITEYAKRIRDLERLRFVQQDRISDFGDDFEVILLKGVQQQIGETELLVVLDSAKKRAVADTVSQISKLLSNLDDVSLRNAALALSFTAATSSNQESDRDYEHIPLEGKS